MKKIFFMLVCTPFIGCTNNQIHVEQDPVDSLEQEISVTETEMESEEIHDNLPDGWFKSGDEPDSFEMGVDSAVFKSGNNSAYIESKRDPVLSFSTMMQTSSAKKYVGKRIKMSGYLKTENVKSWAGMWLRIDPEGGGNALGFDNMEDRSLKGDTDWSLCEIVLDVPEKSYTLNYGVLLNGKGKVWFDDLKFEVVDKSVPTTGREYLTSKNVLENPLNMNFEE